MSRKAIVLYCALVLALSWAIQLALLGLYGLESPQAKVFLLAGMWSPTLLALGFILLHRPARQSVMWKLGNPLFLPVGILVETAIAFIILGVFVWLGWGRSPWFDFSAAGVAISGGPWVLGKGVQAWPLFVANVLATAVGYSIFNLVATVGEEFAWRAFLQGHLTRQFGVRRGIVILGLFWSFWHLPVLLAGYNFPQYPALGAFVLFPIELVGAAFFLGWLTIRSGSFWPAALAHGAINSIQEGVISHLHLTVPRIYEDLMRMGLMVVVGLLCWAALSAKRRAGVRPQSA